MSRFANLFRLLARTRLGDGFRAQIDGADWLNFDEDGYRAGHRDVALAIESGDLASGFQHWTRSGEAERLPWSGLSPYRRRRVGTGSVQRSERLNILFYGPVGAKSGLGVGARGYVDALTHPDWNLEVIDSSACIYLGSRRGSIAIPTIKPDIIVIDHNPDALTNFFKLVDRTILDGAYVIGIWVWEFPSLRPEWVEHFAAVDQVWTPSEFASNAVRCLAPCSVEVRTAPHVVRVPAHTPQYGRQHFGIPEKAFVFLSSFDVSSYVERKNPNAALQAFVDAFGEDPNVVLLMKYHSSGANPVDIKAMRRDYQRSNIIFLDRMVDEAENHALKILTDCFVSSHRAEGFGINIAESMSIERPVICTDYSGNRDFANETNAFPIRYKLVESQAKDGPYASAGVWADPDVGHLSELMRLVRGDSETVGRRVAKAKRDISALLSVDAVGARLRDYVEDILRKGFPPEADLSRRKHYVWRFSLTQTSVPHRRAEIEALATRPKFSVIVPVYNIDSQLLEACVNSVRAQSYPFWELCLCDDKSTREETRETLRGLVGKDPRIKVRWMERNGGISVASNAAVEIATGDYLAFLDNDDTIHPDALFRYAQAIAAEPDADLLYCDEDKIDFKGNYVDHYLKPDWSPEHLESCMYLLHMMVARKSVYLAYGGYRDIYTGAQDYDYALRMSRDNRKIVHVPYVLYHWRMIPGSASAQVDAKPTALINARNALADYAVVKYGEDAYVEDGKLFGLFRVRRGRLHSPPVTLVMTSNNVSKDVPGRGQINLPEHFLTSILEKTDYPDFRVVIASNGVLTDRCRDLLRASGGEEVIYRGSSKKFNFADKANFSIRSSRTELVVLLNDDMEIISSDWLRALVDHAQNPDVGAVGARLLYPDNRIQHVGMFIGVNDTTAHIYHGHDAATVGYNGFPMIVRNYSAVTGACMATRISVFNEVGGFDTSFAIDYNDTDFCLKVRAAGYRIVYSPFAELYHFESQTAVRTQQDPAERNLFLSRWKSLIDRDPYFNPNLDKYSITFAAKKAAWPVQ